MKWLFNQCGRYAARLSLLAADALPEAERERVAAHSAQCAACRAKLAELQSLARGLTKAGRRWPEAEAPGSLRWRWMTAVRKSAAESGGVRGMARPAEAAAIAWLMGRRLAWGSLTATWVLVLFFRFSAPDAPQPASLASSRPVSLRQVLAALEVDHRGSRLRAGAPANQSAPNVRSPRRQGSGAQSTANSDFA